VIGRLVAAVRRRVHTWVAPRLAAEVDRLNQKLDDQATRHRWRTGDLARQIAYLESQRSRDALISGMRTQLWDACDSLEVARGRIVRLRWLAGDRAGRHQRATEHIANLQLELLFERFNRSRAERERDAWRLRARCRPLEDVERAARHAEAELTGGR
jgi:hypothetical protein